MNWKGLVLALMLPLAFAPAGCQTAVDVFNGNINNPLTPKRAFELHAGFTGGIVVAAANYNILPRCTKARAPCSDQKVVDQLRTYVNAADVTLKQLDDWALGNTKLDGPAIYSAAVIAINTATSYAAQNGVR